MLTTLAIAPLLLAPSSPCPAQDPGDGVSPVADASPSWSSFRGAGARGWVDAHALEWGPDRNLAWHVDVPGGGWASPLIVKDRVIIATAVHSGREDGGRPLGFSASIRTPESMGAGAKKPEDTVSFQLHAFALSDGAPLWTRKVAARVPEHGIHPSNTYATETPATDGERIVSYFGAIGLVTTLDLDGEVLWSKELGVHRTGADFGTGSSVLIADGRAILQNDNEEDSFLVALDLADGEEAWRAERPKGTAWASPLLWTRGERSDVVVAGPGTVSGYDPGTGSLRWRVTGISGSFSATPCATPERLVFGNSGPMSRGPLLAVSSGVEGTIDLDDGEATQKAVLWTQRRAGPGFSSPIAVGDLIWVTDSQGILSCRDAATGKELYEERLPEIRKVVASPWTDGERLFVLGEGGRTVVVAAKREFEVLGTNDIEGIYWSTPSAAGGDLLLRSVDTLYCIRRESD